MERVMIKRNRLRRLIDRRLLAEEELDRVLRETENSDAWPEEVLIKKGVPRHEVLLSLAGYYGCPFVEYDEGVVLSRPLMKRLDMEGLKRLLWVPLSASEDTAEVVAYLPEDDRVIEQIKTMLHVRNITFRVALPHDIVRIIEHNQDVSPKFPPAGARTPLALVRTFLADRRSLMACQRTDLAKGRTGLAFIRTGVSFITISLLLLRVVGAGYLSVVELLLLGSGAVMAVDGLLWYIPVRRGGRGKSPAGRQVLCRGRQCWRSPTRETTRCLAGLRLWKGPMICVTPGRPSRRRCADAFLPATGLILLRRGPFSPATGLRWRGPGQDLPLPGPAPPLSASASGF